MTSLALQLESLAVPHTVTSLKPDSKKRASLLFDPQEAANLDKEAVFALGACALEELEIIDDSFSEFFADLFNETSQNWERNLQTEEINKQLDEKLTRFLIKVSPYFLLKPAQKALEWLIYRYHIHLYNVDQLMMCILPYHESNMFIRAVQLLPLEDTTGRWHWLKTVQKHGNKLDRVTLVKQCCKNMGLLRFITNIVTQFIQIHGVKSVQTRTAINFYVTTLMGAMQMSHSIKEELLSHVIPSIYDGLQSKCNEFKAASYMLLSQLVTKIQLKDQVQQDLVHKLVKNLTSELAKEALSCVCIVCQHQENFKMHKCLKYICEILGLTNILSNLIDQYNMKNFLKMFLPKLIRAGLKSEVRSTSCMSDHETGGDLMSGPDYGALLENVIEDLQLDSELALFLTEKVLYNMVQLKHKLGDGMELDRVFEDRGTDILRMLERKYPTAMDLAFEKLMGDPRITSEPNQLVILQGLARVTVSAVKYQIVDDEDNMSLLLSLNHPNPVTRVTGVKHLAKCIQQEQAVTREFSEDALLSRLKDDDVRVVLEVLAIQDLSELVDKEKLIDSLFTVLAQNWKHKKNETETLCLKLLCGMDQPPCPLDVLLLRVLPYVLVPGTLGVKRAKALLLSRLLAPDGRFKQLRTRWEAALRKGKLTLEEDSSDNETIQLSLLQVVATVFAQNSKDKLSSMMKLLERSKEGVDLGFKLLGCIMQQFTSLDDTLPCMEISMAFIHKNGSKGNKGAIDSLFSQILVRLKSVSLVSNGWCSLTESTYKKQQLIITVRIFDYVLTAKRRKHSLKTLINDVLCIEQLIPFLCFVITYCNSDCQELEVSFKMRASCLMLLWQIISKHGFPEIYTNNVVSCVMISMMSECSPVRQAAHECLSLLTGHLKKYGSEFKLITESLNTRKEEVIGDCDHVKEALHVIIPKKVRKRTESATLCVTEMIDLISNPDTPVPIKEDMIRVMSGLCYKDVFVRLADFGCEFLRTLDGKECSIHELACLKLLMKFCQPQLAAVFTLDSPCLKLLLRCIEFNGNVELPLHAIGQLTMHFFHALPSVDIQKKIVLCLLDLYMENKSVEIDQLIMTTLQQVKLDGEHVIDELNQMCPSQKVTSVKGAKRAKIQRTSTSVTSKELPWKRLTFLLEVLQTRKKMASGEIIMPNLFTILNRVLEREKDMDKENPSEYVKQLVLTCLIKIVTQLVKQEVDIRQEDFQVELLVQCIRTSSQQTHRQALLLMTMVAHVFPEYILHNIMSIFTFMGSNLMQQDDAYSLQIISHTTESLIPALVQMKQTGSQQPQSVDDVIYEIIRVFVDAHRHIPAHRSLALFKTLVETVDAEHYLWVVLVCLIENAVLFKTTMSGDVSSQFESRLDVDYEFVLSMCSKFSIHLQMTACIKLLQHLQQLTILPSEAVGPCMTPASRHRKKTKCDLDYNILQLSMLNASQFRLIQYHLSRLISGILSKEDFSNQLFSDYHQANPEVTNCCQVMLKETLYYIKAIVKQQHAPSQATLSKFWKVLLHKVYDLLEKVNTLLPTDSFMEVARSMLLDDAPVISKKLMELLCARLSQLRVLSQVNPDDETSLLDSVDQILLIAGLEISSHGDAEKMANKQLALYTLKLLCKVLGEEHPTEFVKVFPAVIHCLETQGLPLPLLANALLCVAELVSCLKAHAIPYLPQFMPSMLEAVKVIQDKDDEILTNSFLTSLQKIIGTLPLFLSPYLKQILIVVSATSCHSESMAASSKPVLLIKNAKKTISTEIDARVLIPTLHECLNYCLKEKWECVTPLMDVLQLHIVNLSKEERGSHHHQLLALLMDALDFRTQKHTSVPWEQVEKVESLIIEAVLAMVIRVSEAMFRPMFYKLYDWASSEDNIDLKIRMVTFFRLSASLSEKLKSLFNMFVEPTLKKACHILDACNQSKSEKKFFKLSGSEHKKMIIRQVEVILDCLYKCFLHDSEGLVTKELFELLLHPLVDQIENFIEDEVVYDKHVQYVSLCLTQFASAVNDDACWKSLNYQILLKTRHPAPQVRQAALRVTESLTTKLAADYMSLLPETIPFMAELMEDENEQVEALCQQVVSSMEDVLGEPLQKYF